MQNNLARKHHFFSLIRFAMPTIIMMVFMSLYTMVDGVFVSRLISTDALSAVNLVYPFVSVVIALGIMLATGASAVIACRMGEGKSLLAKQNFTAIILIGISIGLLLAITGYVFLHPLLSLLGASDHLYILCDAYIRPLLLFTPAAILQMLFQTFFVTAGKPIYGLVITMLGGIANIVLDYVFIAIYGMGIAGAAIATGIGYSIPAVFGLFYFARQKGTLHFVRPQMHMRTLVQTCSNGASEMVTNLSTAITTYLFNVAMLHHLGSDGVAAITILLYAQYLLTSIFLGYGTGVAPIISYRYGEKDLKELQKLYRISMQFVLLSSVLMLCTALMFRSPIIEIFAPKGSPVYAVAMEGFPLFSICYIFMGINIFGSAFFTALSNGKVSAILSFLRTFLFLVAAIVLLPTWMGVLGIWLAFPLAEGLGVLVTFYCLRANRESYSYYTE